MSDPADEEGVGLKKSDSRRSPTTGHRKRRQEVRRSQSHDLRRGSGKLTSSEEELIEKCQELFEEAKTLRKRSKHKVHEKEEPNSTESNDVDSSEDKTDKNKNSIPWWKAWFLKGKKQEDVKEPLLEQKIEKPKVVLRQIPPEPLNLRELIRDVRAEFKKYKIQYSNELITIRKLRNRCMSELLIVFIFCGLGGFIFKTTEGTFEQFYKCGVKRVKRDFIEELWRGSHHLREDEWKSRARRKLMEFENQLQDAFEAGMSTYSGQRSWSFINAIVYSITVVTTIGVIYTSACYSKFRSFVVWHR